MVAWHDVVHPGEDDGVELHQLDALLAYGLDVSTLQRLVVAGVSESIKHGAHSHTLFHLLTQNVEGQIGNGVVAEVEVFQIDVALRLTEIVEQVFELVVPVEEEFHMIMRRDIHPHFCEVLLHQRTALGVLRHSVQPPKCEKYE